MTKLQALVWRCIWPSWLDGEAAAAMAAFKKYPPGAVTLFKRHVPTLAETQATTAAILTASDGRTRIAVDEEGGPVRRLPAPFPEFPAAASWFAAADVESIEPRHRELGQQLAALGFAIDFSPVADLCFDVAHPALAGRCFASEPEAAADAVAKAVRGLQSGGVAACAKHFPGHGAVALDSHLALDTLHRSVAQVTHAEFLPFRAAIEAGVHLIMAAHFNWPHLDPAGPTTFSRPLLALLRRELGFAGVVLTDDLEMGAIAARWPTDEAALLALTAGYDAVLFCKSIVAAERAVETCVREAERSLALREQVSTAAAKIDRLPQVPWR